VTALASVQSAAGAERAAMAAETLVRVAVGFALANLGPESARRLLTTTWRDLQTEIAERNAGSAAIN
jgi:hypothetical protein